MFGEVRELSGMQCRRGGGGGLWVRRLALSAGAMGLALALGGCEGRGAGAGAEQAERVLEFEERERRLEEMSAEQARMALELEIREAEVSAREGRLGAIEIELEDLKKRAEEEWEVVRELKDKLGARVARGPAPAVVANRAIVVDAVSGEVLFEKNADVSGPIASTQKLLTALLVVERGDLDGEFGIVREDTQAAPTRLGLEVGEQFTRRQLVTALLVRSFNDIAEALARDHSGSVAAFSEAMNERAKELGMESSNFENPHGLPHPRQVSTARDLAKLALAVDGVAEIREMVAKEGFTLERTGGREVALVNTNRVLRSCEWCDGMKTGFTNLSGFCLVCSGEKDGRRRIVVVLNSNSQSVWNDARRLLEWSLEA
jgi:serine-type D-Ala-D-Ala carboxypeptidase (penicillin-binding protein 5/6)